jgi:hypothetical protein
MDVQKYGVNWIQMAQGRDQWKILVSVTMKFVTQYFIIRIATADSPRRALHHETNLFNELNSAP